MDRRPGRQSVCQRRGWALLAITILLLAAPEARADDLVVNQAFTDYLTEQSRADHADTVIIWADRLVVDEDVAATGFDIVIVANSIEMELNTFTINVPSSSSIRPDGRRGHNATVITRSFDRLSFSLPGGSGAQGQPGCPGTNGDRDAAAPTSGGASRGTVGGRGFAGGAGGVGGSLVVHFNGGGTSRIALKSEGGAGGVGGLGGPGGATYAYTLVKILDGGQEIYAEPLQEIRQANGETGVVGVEGLDGTSELHEIGDDEHAALVRQYFFIGPELIGDDYRVLFKNQVDEEIRIAPLVGGGCDAALPGTGGGVQPGGVVIQPTPGGLVVR